MQSTPMKTSLLGSDHAGGLAIHQLEKYITVTCRLKPLIKTQERSMIEIDTHTHAITMNDPTKSISKTYTFDEVYADDVSQGQFTQDMCEPLVRFLKDGGESGLIFSYGITNSGKTYTILGTKQSPGVLLTLVKKLEEEFKDETLRIVACELYKDEFYSLKKKGDKLYPKELRGTLNFDQCHSDVINEQNMEQLFSQYLTNRSCSSTSFNTTSSRSHAIFKIIGSRFRIGIVDLAGSERSGKGQQSSVDIKETIFINRSLLTLKKCIKALEEKSHVQQKVCVPYRESKLTQALMEYFVPSSKINIIVNINQARHCLEQNLNAMEYTSKAKNITANVMSDFSMMLKGTAKKKEEMISALKQHKLLKSSAKKQIIQSQNVVGASNKVKGSFTKYNVSSSQKSIRSKHTEESSGEQYHIHHHHELESIEQQNEVRKPSEQVSTTVDSSVTDNTPQVLIEEIPYVEFNAQRQENEHKTRYSLQFAGEKHKYIIQEEMVENEQLLQGLMGEIEEQERRSFIERKSERQAVEVYLQGESSIEEFIKRQEMFRHYLAVDREFEAEEDRKKLSALKKVNLFQTTKKKQPPQQEVVVEFDIDNRQFQRISTMEIGVGTERDFKRSTEYLNEVMENIEFDFKKLKTNVKRKLIKVLDQEQKKLAQEAEKCEHKHQQSQVNDKDDRFRALKIDQTSPENEESNFTTPSKNVRNMKQDNHIYVSVEKSYLKSNNSNGNQSLLKRTLEKVTSGMKSGLGFVADKVGLGGHIFRTNNKEVRSYSEERRREKAAKHTMMIRNEISCQIDPFRKISFVTFAEQEVQVYSSIKKSWSQKIQIIDDPQVVEIDRKKIVQSLEVGTQTEGVEVKLGLESVIEEVMEEEKRRKDGKRNKRNKQNEKECQREERKDENKKKQILERTAFKYVSAVKKNPQHELKKRPEYLSNAKSVVAHKTRGWRRRHENH